MVPVVDLEDEAVAPHLDPLLPHGLLQVTHLRDSEIIILEGDAVGSRDIGDGLGRGDCDECLHGVTRELGSRLRCQSRGISAVGCMPTGLYQPTPT